MTVEQFFIRSITTLALLFFVMGSVAGLVYQNEGEKLPPVVALVSGIAGFIAGAGFVLIAVNGCG